MKLKPFPWEHTEASFKNDIEYFTDYKNKLCQFIICNTCYKGAHYRNSGHVKINSDEMLGLLKEKQLIQRYIIKLELKKNYTE